MSLNITKETIAQSLRFLNDLNLEEKDYIKIGSLFKDFFEDVDVEKIFIENVFVGRDLSKLDLETMMKNIIKNNKLHILSFLVQKLAVNEDIINEVQDIILEKLI